MELELRTECPDVPAVRHLVSRFLKVQASDESDIAAAEVIVGELLANAVLHATGPVRIWVGWSEREAKLIVQDSGTGFRPSHEPAPPAQEGGRGLALVRAFGREVCITHEAGVGTTVEVTLPVWKIETA